MSTKEFPYFIASKTSKKTNHYFTIYFRCFQSSAQTLPSSVKKNNKLFGNPLLTEKNSVK